MRDLEEEHPARPQEVASPAGDLPIIEKRVGLRGKERQPGLGSLHLCLHLGAIPPQVGRIAHHEIQRPPLALNALDGSSRQLLEAKANNRIVPASASFLSRHGAAPGEILMSALVTDNAAAGAIALFWGPEIARRWLPPIG